MTIRLSPLDSSARLVPRVADQTTVLCPICGQPNPVKAKQCAACGITFTTGAGTEKVDAILEDLLELAKAPPDAASGTSPEAESPDVDETSAEQLFDSLLAEVQPDDAAAEEGGGARVGEAPESSTQAGEAVDRIPVLATPADTEGRKIIRISGRMFDAVTLGSVGALVAVFVFFRMYVNPFDPSNPLPTILFAALRSAAWPRRSASSASRTARWRRVTAWSKRAATRTPSRITSARSGWSAGPRTRGRRAASR